MFYLNRVRVCELLSFENVEKHFCNLTYIKKTGRTKHRMGPYGHRMGPHGTAWNRMGTYGTVWALMKPYGTIWALMGP